MTSNEAESTETTEEGLQQIPATISVTEVPAAADARNKLLAAIGAEAQHVADKSAGQAATALEALARAYALVTSGTAAVAPVAGRSRQVVLSLDSKNSATLLVTPA
ncbi:hypothetical protein ACFVTT_15510 [Streptomyces niveus]|uniref:hypothetical protein n=1 Tax=Streptomyces niveus TaxID=193462 RepID=UPI003435FC72